MSDSVRPSPLRLVLPGPPMGLMLRQVFGQAGLHLTRRLQESGEMRIDDAPGVVDALGCALASVTLSEEDIPLYVEHGVADLGVVRAHTLFEADVQVYRPFTFPLDVGVMALVAPVGTSAEFLSRRPIIRVATPWKRFARDLFARRGWNVEVIPVRNDLELAPLLGLSDAVLTMVEEPRHLESRGLQIIEEVGVSRAKLIANRATGRRRMRVIQRLVELLSAVDGGTF